MFCSNLGPLILNNDEWSTYPSAVTCDMHGTMMMVDVYAHKLAEPPGSSEFAKMRNEPRWVSCQTNNSSVYIDDKGVGTINFGPR